MSSYIPGTRIEFKTDHLGLIGAPGTVNAGDTGTVLGPAPDGSAWLYVEPDAYPKSVCPVDESMIEALS